jgi:hypothetical protein
MSDSPKPPDEPLDVPGSLPEIPTLDPIEPAENDTPSEDQPAPTGLPLVHPPGTQ